MPFPASSSALPSTLVTFDFTLGSGADTAAWQWKGNGVQPATAGADPVADAVVAETRKKTDATLYWLLGGGTAFALLLVLLWVVFGGESDAKKQRRVAAEEQRQREKRARRQARIDAALGLGPT
jgi:hypothetical protein